MKFKCTQKIYLLCNTGAIGDTVSTFPTIKLLTDRNHIEKMFVADKYIDLYRIFFDNDLIIPMSLAMTVIPPEGITPDIPRHVIDPKTNEARFLSYPVNPNIPIVYSLQPLPTSIHSHLIDCFSMTICDSILKDEQKNYPQVDIVKLPEHPLLCKEGDKLKDYVVIAYGATTEHRRMLPKVFNSIKEWFFNNGYQVVLLGKRDHELFCGNTITRPTFDNADFEGCIDLIDITSLPEALSVINDAMCIVGLDNGLIHLAGLTVTPIIAGYTTVDPYYRLPYRHNIKGWSCYTIEPDSNCRYCQTEAFCTYGINFLRCNILTKECQNSLTFDKWLVQLEKWKENQK